MAQIPKILFPCWRLAARIQPPTLCLNSTSWWCVFRAEFDIFCLPNPIVTHSYSQRDLFAPIFRVRALSHHSISQATPLLPQINTEAFFAALYSCVSAYKLRNGKCAPRTVFQLGRNFGISEESDLSIDPVLSLEGSGIGLIFRWHCIGCTFFCAPKINTVDVERKRPFFAQ